MDERELAAKARAELNQHLRSGTDIDIFHVSERKWAYRCSEEDLPLTALQKLDLNA